jgi:hypothetical protein
MNREDGTATDAVRSTAVAVSGSRRGLKVTWVSGRITVPALQPFPFT